MTIILIFRQDMSHLMFRLLFLAALLAVSHVPSHADPTYSNCSSSATFTVNSTFQHNKNQLLEFLSSNASISSFYNTTVGDDVERVYGNFLCFGDISLEVCQSCVRLAAQEIHRLCGTSKEAIIWEENCQLRYSMDQQFFGVMTDTWNQPLANKINIKDEPDFFTDVVRELMGDLSEKAAFVSSANMLATGNSNFMGSEIVYGLVQCTRDLSANDCNRCLRSSIIGVQTCCNSYRGARVLSRSCYLRYELYSFVGVRAENPSTSTDTSRKSRRGLIAAIVGISVAYAGTIVLGIFLYNFLKKEGAEKERTEFSNQDPSWHSDVGAPIGTDFSCQNIQGEDQMKRQEFPLISFRDILRATNNFSDSNKLGEGGFGPVYKGVLPDGKEVAFKRLSSDSEQGSEEFMNEVLLIMKLQHKNLVRLLGCCIERVERILVYEYMPNGGLDAFLDPKRRIHLDWRKRFNIIIGISRGLLYLHQDSRLRIIHRDLKASNVLLDHDLNPKISDFGMARIFEGNLDEASTKRVVGTQGYMAPEYAMEGLYSIRSDVFSFGVLLLEIITGKRNAGFHRSRLAPSLLAYAWHLWSKGNGLELMDGLLTEDSSCNAVEFLRCIQIGLLCVQEDPTVRPNMSSVVVMLGSETLVLPQPQEPAVSVGRFVAQAGDDDQHSLDCYPVDELRIISGVSPR